jgi:hypothetical protein
MRAVETFLFWTFHDGVLGRMIAAVTDGPWSHMGVAFSLDSGYVVYYEALIRDGVQGPKPIDRLHAFAARAPKNRFVMVRLDNIGAEQSELKRVACEEMVGNAVYGQFQLATMLLFERYNIPVFNSPHRVVCSELAARIVAPQVDLRDRRRRRFDEVNPNSAWRRFCETSTGYERFTTPVIQP